MCVKSLKRILALMSVMACALSLAGCSLLYLTRRQAVNIALDNEGISGENCTLVRAELIKEDGGARWEVEFYKDRMEYDYTIDAENGEIIEHDYDIDGFTPDTWSSPSEGVAL